MTRRPPVGPLGLPEDRMTVVTAAATRDADGNTGVVVLDLVEDLPQGATPYCVHGRVTCVGCRRWCWLGDRTHGLVSSGAAAPICRPCVTALVPAGTAPTTNAGDHLRTDGPHP